MPARGASRTSRCPRSASCERLPGAAHPAVYRVRFACSCGDEHTGLVSHDELDWAPLGLAGGRLPQPDDLARSTRSQRSSATSRRAASQAGEWPWSFFCYPEERPRPVFPSAFVLLAPGDGSLGLAVRCPACARISVNLVTASHVDVPFHHDAEIGVVEHVFAEDAAATIAEFQAELYSSRFDARRLAL